jgi:hypothetical protein
VVALEGTLTICFSNAELKTNDKMHTGFWWGSLRKGDHLEYPVVDGRIILKCILQKWNMGAWTGSIWLRIGTGGGLL